MEFQWDDSKAESNLRKHVVPFTEAQAAFADPSAAIFADPDHSAEEEREILVGVSDRGRLLVISFTGRDERIRIISAPRRQRLRAEEPRREPDGRARP